MRTELRIKRTIYFIFCLADSRFAKTKEQFKQIVLSTEFEFNWAKLSWKLTEKLEGGVEMNESV